MEFLTRLRNKPHHIRARFALGTAFSVTAIIGLIWSTTLSTRINEIGGTIQDGAITQTGTLQNGFDTIIQGVSADLAQPTEEPEEVVDPAVEALKIDSVGDLKGWEASATSSSTLPAEKPEEVKKDATNTTETTQNSDNSTPKASVILIGTTTKKAQ